MWTMTPFSLKKRNSSFDGVFVATETVNACDEKFVAFANAFFQRLITGSVEILAGLFVRNDIFLFGHVRAQFDELQILR